MTSASAIMGSRHQKYRNPVFNFRRNSLWLRKETKKKKLTAFRISLILPFDHRVISSINFPNLP